MSIETVEKLAELSTAAPSQDGARAEGEHLSIASKRSLAARGASVLGKRQSAYFARKYLADRIVGSILLVFFSPLIAILWLAVRATSPGPGFYRQRRVGLHGQLFTVVKLRTMTVDAEAGGHAWCEPGDVRITPLGVFLRKAHLDELPQLWNVARGEMCLVGPRPERPEITRSLAVFIPDYYLRNCVKPGVTGLAQVNLEPDTNINVTRCKQILDLRYIAQANLLLDCRMLAATALRICLIKGDLTMRLMGLKQEISDDELREIGYQFDVAEEDLWNPSKPMPAHVEFPVTSTYTGSGSIQTSFTQFEVASNAIPNAFTIDVEDYFQVAAFEQQVSRKHWDKYQSRVEMNTDRMLKLLNQRNVTATFFVLGWVAERYPKLIQRIHRDGHEIGSHGYWHQLIYNQTPEDFADDLENSCNAIAEATGVNATAYRAPCFSVTQNSLWAFDILAEKGFLTDSSIFPIRGHDLYGMPEANRSIHEISTRHGRLIEFPASALHLPFVDVPIGGGYFRLLPYSISTHAVRTIRQQNRPVMFYTHPWEIDDEQPRIAGAGFRSNVRHYTGLRSTYQRLDRLLASQSFASMDQVITAVRETQLPHACKASSPIPVA